MFLPISQATVYPLLDLKFKKNLQHQKQHILGVRKVCKTFQTLAKSRRNGLLTKFFAALDRRKSEILLNVEKIQL